MISKHYKAPAPKMVSLGDIGQDIRIGSGVAVLPENLVEHGDILFTKWEKPPRDSYDFLFYPEHGATRERREKEAEEQREALRSFVYTYYLVTNVQKRDGVCHGHVLVTLRKLDG